jgi:chaperonin GroEL
VKVISAPKSFFAIVHVSWATSLTLQICEQMPTYTIAANAGVEGAVVVGKLLEQNNLDIGYDAARGMLPVLHVVDMFITTFFLPSCLI